MSVSLRLIGILLVLAAFGPALNSSFHFDDYSLLGDPAVTSAAEGWRLLTPDRTRPLTHLTYWLNYRLGGDHPAGYHAVDLLLHLGVIWLAYGVFSRLVSKEAALLACAVFALHPLQTESVVYIFSRATLLATLCCLLCWRAWLRDRDWLAVFWFAAALLCKEEAIAFPAFLAGYEWLHRSQDWRALKQHAKSLAVMMALAALAAAWLFHAARVTEGSGVAFDLGEITPATYLLTQGRVIWTYLGLALYPVGLNFDRDVRLSHGGDAGAVTAWAALALLVAVLLWLCRERRDFYWPLGALVLLAPTSSIVPLADLAAERRMYLPMLSLSLGLGVLLASALRRSSLRVIRFAPLALAVLLAAGAHQRSRVWQTEESLWSDTEEKSPRKVRPKLQLARALAVKGEQSLPERLELLAQARRLEPGNLDVAAELGVFHLQTGNPGEARRYFDQIIEAHPHEAQALANYGVALFLLGRREEAVDRFQRALVADPCNFDARNNLIHVRNALGEEQAARQAAQPPENCRFTPEQSSALAAASRSTK